MELQEALYQISEIRRQMARSAVFRGYRAFPAALSAVLAVSAAGVQRWLAPNPQSALKPYVWLWVATAVASAIVFAVEMSWRYRRSGMVLDREATRLAVEQFIPCVIAGALVTLVMVRNVPWEHSWVLPGIWQVLFSMGIFASRRLLPSAIFWAAAWYLLCGIATLALAQGAQAYSPLAMAIPFGIGQSLVAAILYWNLERRSVRENETDQ